MNGVNQKGHRQKDKAMNEAEARRSLLPLCFSFISFVFRPNSQHFHFTRIASSPLFTSVDFFNLTRLPMYLLVGILFVLLRMIRERRVSLDDRCMHSRRSECMHLSSSETRHRTESWT